jgi:glutamate/tyrosine decarboxylase-like PLP-dependent enzyme
MKRPELDPDDVLALRGTVDLAAELARVSAARSEPPVLARSDPAELDALVPEDPPREGAPLGDVLDLVHRLASAHSRKNGHPGFFGYICAPGLPTDPIAHALGALMNQNVTGFPSAPGATAVEQRLLGWLARLLGLPRSAGGLLVSGGSLANLTAIATALHARAGAVLAESGIAALTASRGAPALYCADTAHFSIERAVRLLGLGAGAIRRIPIDRARRMIPAELDAAIARDAEAGAFPFAVVASAGSTTTGAIDPLPQIAAIATRRGLWLHVDAAYGGAAALSPDLSPRLAGIERADSVCLDFHKWLYLALDASALLFRDPGAALAVHYARGDYASLPRDGGAAEFAFYHLGPETSRRFRALPAFLALSHFGVDRIGRNVLHNVRCAEHLALLVERHPDLELAAPVELSIACFRFAPQALAARGDGAVDRVNAAIRDALERQGDFYLSPTELGGRPVLRVCIVNDATRAAHVERLLAEVVRLGWEFSAGG